MQRSLQPGLSKEPITDVLILVVYAVIGDILAAGGFGTSGLLNLAEVYSIVSGT